LLYAWRLVQRCLVAGSRPTSPEEVVTLLAENGFELEEEMAVHVNLFEVQTLDEEGVA
jgi:hypothetical protein